MGAPDEERSRKQPGRLPPNVLIEPHLSFSLPPGAAHSLFEKKEWGAHSPGRKRPDLRPQRGRESQCRDGVSIPGTEAVPLLRRERRWNVPKRGAFVHAGSGVNPAPRRDAGAPRHRHRPHLNSRAGSRRPHGCRHPSARASSAAAPLKNQRDDPPAPEAGTPRGPGVPFHPPLPSEESERRKKEVSP